MSSSSLSTPKQACSALRISSAVVIGGGPVGLLTAINLHLRGVPVTVIERNHDYTRIDPPRSYAFHVDWRGRRALQSVPDLYDFIVTDAILYDNLVLHMKSPQGKVKQMTIPRASQDGIKKALMLRFNMLHKLYQFATKCHNITFLLGATLTDIDFSDNGSMELSLTLRNNEEKKISSMMLFACDGRNSSTGSIVDKAATDVNKKEFLSAVQGFGCSEADSASTGLKIKSLLMSEDYFMDQPTKSDDIPLDSHADLFMGSIKGEKTFRMGVFRLSKTVSNSIGGCLGSVVRPSDHYMWKLKDKEEAFQLFQTNFPQLRVRECVTDEIMQQFVTTPPLTFGSVKRRNSLVVKVGTFPGGGIVFLGDAAHSFPPESGQGVNSAFQDVSVLMSVFDDVPDDPASKGPLLGTLLEQYHNRRETDVDSLVKIVRQANPYQYGQNKMRLLLAFLNSILRRKLALVFPGLIHRSVNDQLLLERSYTEIKIRADETTRRLKIAAFSLFIAPLVGYAATMFRNRN